MPTESSTGVALNTDHGLGWSLAAGFAGAAALVAAVFIRYPLDPVHNPLALGGSIAAIVLLAALAGWALLRRQPRREGAVLGAAAGVIFGALWVIEIGYNNFIAPPVAIRDPVDDLIWAAVAIGMFAISAIGARRARRVAAGIRVGVWSGLVSGLMACLMALLLVVFGMRFLLADPANIQEYAVRGPTSGFPDKAAYLAYQTMAGALLHLIVLGVVMGALLGCLGGLLGVLAARRKPFDRLLVGGRAR